MSTPLVTVEGLGRVFPGRGGESVHALRDVSLSIGRGEIFGLVGESGSGKSTLGRCLLQLDRADTGSVHFDGIDLHAQSSEQVRRLRSRMQMVFQDPHSSLNRRQSVAAIIEAPLRAHGTASRSSRAGRVRELLDLVQLPASAASRRPHELSGGQAQRVAIARALAVDPEFVVFDEAVSALDVSIRAQVLNLVNSLQQQLGLTCLFISHDLSVVRYLCPRVGVLYRGELVELADRETLFGAPSHPYTRRLLEAVPIADPAQERARLRSTRPGGPT
jgi:ABC-type oligopeptide transport system ATPase subunit